MKVHDNEGLELDASFSLEMQDGAPTLVVESRGGKKGAPNARNLAYNEGLELLLYRLGECGVTIESIVLDTRETRHLSLNERRLELRSRPYPVSIHSGLDIRGLRLAISKAQRRSDGSGSPSKRLRFFLNAPEQFRDPDLLASRLRKREQISGSEAATPLHSLPGAVDTLMEVALDADAHQEFDAINETDARRKILRAIALRQGQPQFRKALIRAYRGQCAISGCDVEAVLEAAHIVPFRGEDTNHVQNGLLLRADIHTLFDRGLIAIDEENWTVLVHPGLRHTVYNEFHHQRLARPEGAATQPSKEALGRHRADTWAAIADGLPGKTSE